jgi:HlyD family secretion protein
MNAHSHLHLTLLIPVLMCGLGCPQNTPPPPKLDRVVALGRLEPADGLLSISAPVGDRVEQIDGEMARVYEKAGLEMGKLASWADRDREYKAAQTQTEEAEQRRQLVQEQGNAQIAEAEERLNQLQKQQEPDLKAQKGLIDAIQARKNQAEASLKDMTGSDVGRAVVEQQRNVVHSLDVELRTANLKHDQTRSAYTMNIALAAKQVETARATLARLLAEVPAKSLKMAEEAAAERRRHSLIQSPGTGQILKLYIHAGETVGATPILRFGDTRRMVAVAEVYETDVNRIHEGDSAVVEYQDVPPDGATAGQVKLHGTVSRIGRVVSPGTALDLNPAANADRRVIDVRVDLDQVSSEEAARFVNRQVRVIIDTPKP